MNAQAAVIDNQISPRARDQVPFADDFRRVFHEHGENVESPATDLERVAVPLEQTLRCPQAKRAEGRDSRRGCMVRAGRARMSVRSRSGYGGLGCAIARPLTLIASRH
jgi:hypothetical protein